MSGIEFYPRRQRLSISCRLLFCPIFYFFLRILLFCLVFFFSIYGPILYCLQETLRVKCCALWTVDNHIKRARLDGESKWKRVMVASAVSSFSNFSSGLFLFFTVCFHLIRSISTLSFFFLGRLTLPGSWPNKSSVRVGFRSSYT